jgi:hypothetical protein
MMLAPLGEAIVSLPDVPLITVMSVLLRSALARESWSTRIFEDTMWSGRTDAFLGHASHCCDRRFLFG